MLLKNKISLHLGQGRRKEEGWGEGGNSPGHPSGRILYIIIY